MILPNGTKLVIDGGSFTGDLTGGNAVKLKNDASVVGTVTNMSVEFSDNEAVFPSTGNLTTNNCNISFNELDNLGIINFSNSTVNGSDLICGGTTSFSAPLKLDNLTLSSSSSTVTLNNTTLTVTNSLSCVDSSIINGAGYLAVPSTVTVDESNIGENVILINVGAEITGITLTNVTHTSVRLRVERTDSTQSYMVEKRLGSEANYTLVNAACTDDEIVIETTYGEPNVIRVFDGENYFTDVVYEMTFADSSAFVYTVEAHGQSSTIYRREPIAFMGQILHNDQAIKRSEVSSVKVSLYQYEDLSNEWTAIPQWTNVNIDKKCFYESEKELPLWNSEGLCNFCWLPNQDEIDLTTTGGKYKAEFVATLTDSATVNFTLNFEAV